jgi:geranylgeranyl diphosphate synthase type I
MSVTTNKALKDTDFKEFSQKINDYKKLINNEIELLSVQLLADTKEQFGEVPGLVVDAYLKLLNRGGKRIRGALAIASYEMFGGTNQAMIVRAAAALEILNTYILVADDIQDRSESRRGGETVHTLLKQMHTKGHLKGDSTHYGEALAINSLLIAQHYAANLILTLDAPENLII